MFISNDRCYNLEWDFILFGYNLVMFISNDRCYNLEWDFILFGYNLVMFISNDRCYNLEWDFILFGYNVWKNEFLYIEAFADTCIRICRYSALVLVPALMKIPSVEKICMLLGNVCLYVCLYFYNISPPSYSREATMSVKISIQYLWQ